MLLNGQLLNLAPTLSGSIDALAAAPRMPFSTNGRAPMGSRVGYVELVGLLDSEYMADVRRRIARLAADKSVRAITVLADSPGGTVNGCAELAQIVQRAAAVKPVYAIAEGLMASACYFALCQATHISVSPSCVVGSVGTIIYIVDSHELFQRLGLKVLVIASGKHKGAGVPGLKVEDDTIAMLRRLVDSHTAAFQAAIMRGRRMSANRVMELSDGSIWTAADAKKLGLVDDVALPEDVIDRLEERIPAEQFTYLKYGAALEKWQELVCAAAKVDDIGAAPPSTIASFTRQYPTLAARAAKEAEDQASRTSSRRHRY